MGGLRYMTKSEKSRMIKLQKEESRNISSQPNLSGVILQLILLKEENPVCFNELFAP